MKKLFTLLAFAILFSCSSEKKEEVKQEPITYKQGYDQSKYLFEERKVKRGDTFGDILEDEGIDYPEIYQAIQTTKDDVSFRKLQLGKPYTLIFTNDSIRKLKAFVYHPTIEGYSFIQLRDSVYGKTFTKPRSYKDLSLSLIHI